VKLGYPVDGNDPTQLEHLWFEVHALNEKTIDATVANKPRHVSSLKLGQRGLHPVELLTDWTLLTLAGSINPRDTRPARDVRLNRNKLRSQTK
jgi:uncharacterized protein YegJ (DUF2314 family)